jgi:hypothetical protein
MGQVNAMAADAFKDNSNKINNLKNLVANFFLGLDI